MGLTAMIDSVKGRSDYSRVGMIVCHNGVVRGNSRDGRPVTHLDVTADRERLAQTVAEMKGRPGIIDVQAEVFDGRLEVGDDILLAVVAGDIRENTFPVLSELVNAIKRNVLVEKES